MNSNWNPFLGDKDPVMIVEWDKCFTTEWSENSASICNAVAQVKQVMQEFNATCPSFVTQKAGD